MKHPLLSSIKTITLWFIAISAIALIGLFRFNFAPDTAYDWMGPDFLNTSRSISPVLAQWDGQWYIDLAENGYWFDKEGLSNVAFLPLFPVLLHIVQVATGSYVIAGLIINLFALVGTVYYLRKLAAHEGHTSDEQTKSILALLMYPTAIFFLALYTESLFVFLITACFYFLKQKKWWIAGVFGLLASLTRIPGVFLFFPFVYYLWKEKSSLTTYFSTLLLPLGTCLYLLAQKLSVGSFFAFLQTQENWGRSFFTLNAEHFTWATSAAMVNGVLDGLISIILLAFVYIIYKKLDLGYAVFVLVSLLIPLLTGTTMSMIRFGMVLFPIALVLPMLKKEVYYYGWMGASLILLTFYTTQFVNGYWAG